ncbi:MAG: 3-beta hydroxysteroid dehydrogenase [Desulfobacteraceae bacterium 4572_130]|nr:MAG: 3-beta hydroxysteroid dehydrogenase [Desulfobacteraceae bacterium 4572_130]
MITRENVLVTGGGGFLGKAIIKKLLKNGNYVKSFSRNYYPELKDIGVSQIQGDISHANAVKKACKNIDVVYHVAAKTGIWGNFSNYFKVNVLGTTNVIKSCLNNKVARLVYTSSPSVVFDGNDLKGINESASYPRKYYAHYPKTKAMAEKLVKNAGYKDLKTIILRPHLIWGPGDNHLFPRIIKKASKLKILGNRKNFVDTIYIDNAADAHILANHSLKKNPLLSGNIYFISQDEPILLWDMIDKFLNIAGFPSVKGSVPAWTAWFMGFLFEFLFFLLKLEQEPPMTRFLAKELTTSHWFDISKAKKDLGYSPDISTKEGLYRLKKWFKSQSNKNNF